LGNIFVDEQVGAITDDHVYLLSAGIPTIDIIEAANPATGSFSPTWHTLDDNIDNIDRTTLSAVGRTVTNIIYKEKSN
jgi:Iap family predicted aminopeptidase